MTGREIVSMAFAFKETPRIPVTLIGGGSWAVHQAGKTFAAIKENPGQIAEVFIQYFERFEHDLFWTGSNFINYPIHFLGCAIKDDSSDSPALQGTVLQNFAEMEKLKIDKVLNHPTMKGIIRSHHLLAEAIGKKAFLMATQWAPFTFTTRILGMEATMMATINDPDNLLKLIQFSTELIWALLEPVLDHEDILGANFADPAASGDLISPLAFRKFAAPALRDLVQKVKAKKKFSMIHICGNTTKILPDVLEIGPNCYSLENKVDLAVAKEILGGKVCVAGNVSPTGAFLSGAPGEVIAEAKTCLAAWGKLPGYILTIGCDFTKNVPEENMLALMSFKK